MIHKPEEDASSILTNKTPSLSKACASLTGKDGCKILRRVQKAKP